MSGPGDPEWERRRAVVHGEEPKPDAGDAGAAFTGDGPAGENINGPEVAGDDDKKADKKTDKD